jgi:predicted metal-dependent hydrolase
VAKAKTPADLVITPRDRRFGRGAVQARWWMHGDPVGTAFHNALSVTFPKGEAFFIESVKAFRDGVSPKLAEEIRAFTQQEVMHSREHLAFNHQLIANGYDVSVLEHDVDESLTLTRDRPPILNLVVTAALEHYTAVLAVIALSDPRYFGGVDAAQADMWRWHAVEEIEHKGVAYDTWLHATRDWRARRRWFVRSFMMFKVSQIFWAKRIRGTLNLLAQDGITGWRAKARLAWYLLGYPGLMRRMSLPVAAFFRPGFHPWQRDDRALIGKAESAYADAQLVPA